MAIKPQDQQPKASRERGRNLMTRRRRRPWTWTMKPWRRVTPTRLGLAALGMDDTNACPFFTVCRSLASTRARLGLQASLSVACSTGNDSTGQCDLCRKIDTHTCSDYAEPEHHILQRLDFRAFKTSLHGIGGMTWMNKIHRQTSGRMILGRPSAHDARLLSTLVYYRRY